MISYSVYMLPNRMDENAKPKAYAKAQMSELMTFSKFVDHIVKHNGVYTRGTVRGVIIDMCECLVEMLLEGKKVMMGELGNFWISLSSEGADTLEHFSAQNIKAVNIVFTPGTDFENLLNRTEFNVVSSRVAQIATLKAEKAQANTVDLEAAKAALKNGKKDSTGGTATTGESGKSNETGGDSSETGVNTSNGGSTESGGSGSESGGDF